MHGLFSLSTSCIPPLDGALTFRKHGFGCVDRLSRYMARMILILSGKFWQYNCSTCTVHTYPHRPFSQYPRAFSQYLTPSILPSQHEVSQLTQKQFNCYCVINNVIDIPMLMAWCSLLHSGTWNCMLRVSCPTFYKHSISHQLYWTITAPGFHELVLELRLGIETIWQESCYLPDLGLYYSHISAWGGLWLIVGGASWTRASSWAFYAEYLQFRVTQLLKL